MGTATGPANLEADWTANTLTIDWYSGDTKLSSNTCTYDGQITLPSSNPTKTGYTFKGWQVRSAVAPRQCSLSGVNWNLQGSSYAYKDPDGSVGPNVNQDVTAYGISIPGEFGIIFDYGLINGVAKCSSKTGDNTSRWTNDSSNWTATGSELITAGNGAACWCKITSLTENNSKCTFIGDIFVYYDSYNSQNLCAESCAATCSRTIERNTTTATKFRTAIYSITQ